MAKQQGPSVDGPHFRKEGGCTSRPSSQARDHLARCVHSPLALQDKAENAGTNDSAMDKKHVPLGIFRQNIETILQLLTSPQSPYAIAHSKTPVSIFLISPAGVEDSMRDDPDHVRAEKTKAYVDAVLEIGDRWVKRRQKTDNWKIGVIDLHGAIQKAGEHGGKRRFYTYVQPPMSITCSDMAATEFTCRLLDTMSFPE
jgi:hypothetical protein